MTKSQTTPRAGGHPKRVRQAINNSQEQNQALRGKKSNISSKQGNPSARKLPRKPAFREAGGHPAMPPQLGGPYGNIDQNVKRTI